MSPLMENIFALGRLSLEDPRKAARALLNLGIPVPARTAGLMLVAVGSALVTHLGFLLTPPPDDPMMRDVMNGVMASPFRTAELQWVVLAASVALIFWVGRVRGGSGGFADSLLIVVWLQLLMLVLQILQLLALVLVPPLAGIIYLGGLVLFFWLMTNFIAELHGFKSRGAVLAGILITMFTVAFLLVVIIALVLGPEALTNV